MLNSMLVMVSLWLVSPLSGACGIRALAGQWESAPVLLFGPTTTVRVEKDILTLTRWGVETERFRLSPHPSSPGWLQVVRITPEVPYGWPHRVSKCRWRFDGDRVTIRLLGQRDPDWSSPRKMESRLGVVWFIRPFKLDRGQEPQRGMTADAVVERLHVLEDARLRLGTGCVPLVVNQLPLQCCEEALHRSVVPALSHTAHAAHDPLTSQHAPVVFAGVLAPAIRVHQQPRTRTTTLDRHRERIYHQPALHRVVHRPAHNHPAEQILDHRQVQPTVRRRNVGDVRGSKPRSGTPDRSPDPGGSRPPAGCAASRSCGRTASGLWPGCRADA